MTWLTVIGAIIQLTALIVKNWFERDAAERARKDSLHAEAKEAVFSGDNSRITAAFDKLRS